MNNGAQTVSVVSAAGPEAESREVMLLPVRSTVLEGTTVAPEEKIIVKTVGEVQMQVGEAPNFARSAEEGK